MGVRDNRFIVVTVLGNDHIVLTKTKGPFLRPVDYGQT